MDKLKALIGMIKWKMLMRKYKDLEPYTDEWWEKMESALQFVPEEQRKMLFEGVILAGLSL